MINLKLILLIHRKPGIKRMKLNSNFTFDLNVTNICILDDQIYCSRRND
jgi:hypothetical protein